MSKNKHDLNIIQMSVKDLVPYNKNSRKHSPKQISMVATSISEFGFINPVIIDKNNGIVAGHARFAAAKKLKLKTIPCIKAAHLTEAQKRAFVIADNRLAELAEWDDKILQQEIIELAQIDFDLKLTGFDDDFIQNQLTNPDSGYTADENEDNIPKIPNNMHKVKLGDIWQLGNHRLICGDSTSLETVEKLMGGIQCDFGFSDPPYNLGYEYNTYDDNLTDKEYEEFSHKWYGNFKKFTNRRAVTLGTKNIGIMSNLDKIAGVACWVKKNWITSCHIAKLQQWEPIYFYGDFTRFKRNSDLFEINRKEQKDTFDHTCPKQIELIVDILEHYSQLKVLDLFLGSGSTLIACEKIGRHCFGVELDPHYCSVIIQRYIEFVGTDEGVRKVLD